MGCFVRGGKNGMGCFVWGDKNCMGCFVQGGKLMRGVLSNVAKKGHGMFCPGMFCPTFELGRGVLTKAYYELVRGVLNEIIRNIN